MAKSRKHKTELKLRRDVLLTKYEKNKLGLSHKKLKETKFPPFIFTIIRLRLSLINGTPSKKWFKIKV